MMKKRFFRRDCLFIFGWSLLDEQSLMILRPHLVTDIIAAGWPYAKVSNSSKKKNTHFYQNIPQYHQKLRQLHKGSFSTRFITV